jgi:hypothetical protein
VVTAASTDARGRLAASQQARACAFGVPRRREPDGGGAAG